MAGARLGHGDHVAIFSENQPRFFEVMWAALRSGLYVTTINSYLSAEEVGYILQDSGARSLVTTSEKAKIASAAMQHATGCVVPLLIGDADPRFEPYADAIGSMSTDPLDEQPAGEMMLYSSGTTGRPKGVKRPLSGKSVADGMLIAGLVSGVFGMSGESTYLSPAPLYHSAPIGSVLAFSHWRDGRRDGEVRPVDALHLIGKHAITDSQWVPTMFIGC